MIKTLEELIKRIRPFIQTWIENPDHLNVGTATDATVGNVNASGVYEVDGIQVVSNRVVDARCDDTINTATWDATTAGVLDALRDAMVTHGLIRPDSAE